MGKGLLIMEIWILLDLDLKNFNTSSFNFCDVLMTDSLEE